MHRQIRGGRFLRRRALGVWVVRSHGRLAETRKYRRAGRPTLVVLSMLSHFRDIDVKEISGRCMLSHFRDIDVKEFLGIPNYLFISLALRFWHQGLPQVLHDAFT